MSFGVEALLIQSLKYLTRNTVDIVICGESANCAAPLVKLVVTTWFRKCLKSHKF